MRIGIFTDSYLPDINGVVTSVVTLKKALEQLGHTVFIITNHSGVKIINEGNILRLPGVEIKKLYGYKMSMPLNYGANDYIEAMNLDVIHVQQEFGVSLYGRQMAKQLNIPVVYTYHTMYEDYTHYINPLDFEHVERAGKWVVRNLSKFMANTVQGVIAPSNKTKQALIDYGVVAPIYIVPTGLDLDKFNRNNLDAEEVLGLRESLGFDQDDHVVVFVGRLAKEKALEMPIEAIAKNSDPKLHLVVVGSGTDEDYFKQEAEKWNALDKVHFVGKVPAEEIPYYYAAFDAFVSASLSETQGLTYIEALACGLPIFARRDEVLDGLIDEGQSGYYFDSAEELNKKINQYFACSLEERMQKQKAAIDKTEQYSTKTFGQKALVVYQQAIDDYQNTFCVEKVKVQDDFVQLTLQRDCDDDNTKILIPMDDFFELKIGVDTKLDAYLISLYVELQEYYLAYRVMKRRVLTKDYTKWQVRQYIRNHFGLDDNNIDQLISELTEKGWINDAQYAMDKADYWHVYGQSKRSIANKLRKVGISESYIEAALEPLKDEIELKNAKAVALQLKKTIKEQSNSMKQKTIINKLLVKGYSFDIANEVLESLEFEEDDHEALMKTIKKAKRLYSSLEPQKRRQKIRLFCLRKGFSSSEVDEWIESEEDND